MRLTTIPRPYPARLAAAAALITAITAGPLASSVAASTSPAQPAIAEASDPSEPMVGSRDVVALRAVHDRQRATMDFEVRFGKPVPVPRPRAQEYTASGLALSAVTREGLREAVRVGIGIFKGETTASYGLTINGVRTDLGPLALSISSDRKVLRAHVQHPRLGEATYASASVRTDGSNWGGGPSSDSSDFIGAVFDLPLESLSAALSRGRLTVSSAPGALVRVSIRRNRGRPTVVRYRQDTFETPHETKLLYRFCGRRARYLVAVRARDKFGNRRTMSLRSKPSSGCAPPPRYVTARVTNPSERRGAARPPDIVAMRAVSEPESGTMLFEMRLRRPVPRKAAQRLRLAWRADDDFDSSDSINAVGAYVDIGPRGAAASHYITSVVGEPLRPVRTRFHISRDRKLLRVRVRDRRLRGLKYRNALARTVRRPRRGNGPGTELDRAKAFFPIPLYELALDMSDGRMLVRSAVGARVRVSIRRNREKPVVLRYRQEDAETSQDDNPSESRLKYLFRCPAERTTYRVVVRARDSLGRRSTAKARPHCGRYALANIRELLRWCVKQLPRYRKPGGRRWLCQGPTSYETDKPSRP